MANSSLTLQHVVLPLALFAMGVCGWASQTVAQGPASGPSQAGSGQSGGPQADAEPSEVQYTEDSVPKIQETLKAETAIVIDVRSQGEWDAGHLAVAKWIPMDKFADLAPDTQSIEGLGKDKAIYIYCRSGNRAMRAAKILQAMGYQVRPLKAGFQQLVDEGMQPADR